MAGKITEYPNQALTLKNGDLMDVSVNLGGGLFESKSLDWQVLLTQIPTTTTLYSGDSSLSGNRVVTMLGSSLLFSGGETTFKGIDDLSANYGLKVQNNSGVDLFNVRNDGFVGINTITQLGTEKLRVNGEAVFGKTLINTNVDLDQAFNSDVLSVGGAIVTNRGFTLADYSIPTNPYNFRIFQSSSNVAYMHFGRWGTIATGITMNLSNGIAPALTSWAVEGGAFYAYTGVKADNNPTGFIQDLEQYGYGIRTENKDFQISTVGNGTYTTFKIEKGGGNIGINEINPAAKLDIRGIDDLSSNYGLKVQNNSGVDLFNVRNDGFIGIGITSPLAKLEIKSTTSGLRITPMTSAQASAISSPQLVEGLFVFVSDTDATFTSIGLWIYENGAWKKL